MIFQENPRGSFWTRIVMRLSTILASSLFLSATAQAQIGPGELVLTYPASNGSSVEHYSSLGVLQGSFTGSENSWISSALMPNGNLLVHNNSTSVGIRVLDSSGVQVNQWFYIPAQYSADMDVFPDTTVAICSRGEGVLLFDQAGVQLGVLNPAGMIAAQGCQTQLDGTIWVADMGVNVTSGDGIVWHLDRQGNVLHSFPTALDPSDVAQAPDGSVWVSDWNGEIAHYSANGTLILQFPATINSGLKTLWSLALDFEGRIWASGHYDSMVYAYDQNGNIVSSFDTQASGNSTYSFFTSGISSDSAFCFGDGSGSGCPCGNAGGSGEGCMNSTAMGATLAGMGQPGVLTDTLVLNADHLIPGQAALLFAGQVEVNGGAGQFFGDGLLCVGGGIQRIGVQIPDGTGHASWGPGLIATLGWQSGQTRYLQAWYRDTGGFPCGTGFNTSNALKVVITP